MTFSNFWSRDWGPTFCTARRLTVAVLALLITIGSITAECAYQSGRLLRLALEARNNQLAAFWVRALGVGAATSVTATPPSMVAAPVAPPPAPGKPPRPVRKAAAVAVAPAKPRSARRRKAKAPVLMGA